MMTSKPEQPSMPGRTKAVMAAIRARLANRTLAAGERLPSIRGLAASMGVSPSTIVEAYDRLAAEGLIQAQRGSGFYVAPRAAVPLTLTETGPKRDRAVDPFWVSRQSLDTDQAVLRPGCGWLPPSWMPTAAMRRALRSLGRAADDLLTDYGNTRGALVLRRLLLARFAEEGMTAHADQLLLTGSGTQALDMVCRFLLRPGDIVLVDDPCYFNFRALLRAHQVTVVSVPYTQTGPDLARFEAILATERPRLYVTNSALHNPTGATLSPATAHRLLTLAAAHDLTIIEDDIFAEFEPDPSPRLASLDGLQRVIRIGSFSKTISASARCGYIAARADWIEDLIDLQVATNFSGPSPILAAIIAHVLTDSGYRKHRQALHVKLSHARQDAAARLQGLGIEPWTMPRGGFNLWCQLPAGIESTALAKRAMAEDVVLAPGNVFSVVQSAQRFMRFNVAHCSEPRFWEVLARSLKAEADARTMP